MKFKKRGKRLLLVLIIIIAAILIAFAVYVSNYYHAEVDVEDYMAGEANAENFQVTDVYEMGQDIGEGHMVDGLYVINPDTDYDSLVIFYPGAKVEHTAYLPLCYELASYGVDCYIVKMPCNLAFFGMNKAEKIMEAYEYGNYYLMGHSLGGAMGASFASKHLDALDGMIFLASYPVKSLAAQDFKTLSVYGSEDTVLNMEKVAEGRQYMPDDYTEVCIDGGNHAQFGNYGFQDGDQPAWIAREEQQSMTVEAIIDLIKEDTE